MALARSPLVFIFAGAFLAYVAYTRLTLYRRRQRMKREHGCEPNPYVFNKDPIFGLDVFRQNAANFKSRKFLERNRARFVQMKANTFHNIFMGQRAIVTMEPEIVKTILSLKFKDYSFGNRKAAFEPLLGHGIFNSDGEKWSQSRHLLRPNFAREQIADLEAFERHFKLFMKHLPRDGSTVDLQKLFFMLTIDTATEFLFNHSTDSLRMRDELNANNEDAIFGQAFNDAQEDAITRIRWGFLNRFRPNEKGNNAIRVCHEYIEKFVDDAINWSKQQDHEKLAGAGKHDGERYIFIRELAQQTDDKKRLRDELVNILLAGRDTTASLLSNAFFEIAKRPEIYAKLREEAASLNGRLPTYEELRNLKYLKWCLNESLRLNPVVPGNSRYAIRDTVLPVGGGVHGASPLFVPAGTIIGYSPYAMHRRHDLYGPDADEFKPERWEKLRPGWEYLPFNGGPRICLGQQYALTEASYVAVRLVQEFSKMESRDENGGVWVEALTLTCCSGNGTKVSLTPA